MSSITTLVIATLVQAGLFMWLVPTVTIAQVLVLVIGGGLALALGGWLVRLRRRPMERLIGRLESLVTTSGVQVAETEDEGSKGEAGSGELWRVMLSLREHVKQSLAETRRLTVRAEEAGVYRTAFLQAVAHELRTPLNAILGFTDVLLSGIEGPLSDDRRENLEVLKTSAQRLLSLFNDAIELSTMASGQLSLRREQVDLRDLLEAAVAVLNDQLASAPNPRPVHLAVEASSPLPIVGVQRDRMLRVLEILGAYAIARTPAGVVRFVVSTSKTSTSVEVHDDGAVFTTAEIQVLFSPERAKDSEVRRDALRLSIARQLATLHGGMLIALAEVSAPRFVLTLPAATSEANDA